MILLTGLIYDNNLGDQAIYQCTKEMVEEVLSGNQRGDIQVCSMDMTGKSGYDDKQKPDNIRLQKRIQVVQKIKSFLKSYVIVKEARRIFREIKIKSRIHTACKKNITQDTSAIIIVGGGIIKYAYQEFFLYIDAITRRAEKMNIPVMLSAVGVEGYDFHNRGCRILKKAINRKCVKMITTRDDLEVLQENYIVNQNIWTARVADPACSLNMEYSLRQKQASHCIGLGTVRENLFIDNGIAFSKEQMLSFWSEIYHELIHRGYTCRLFCNGLEADYKFACELALYLGLDEKQTKEILCPRPRTVEELVSCITMFDSVIVGRLHASIIAYAYNITSIGLVWNNKQLLFGGCIGHKERFITRENFTAKAVVDAMETAMNEGYDLAFKEEYCKTTREYLERFLKSQVL